MRQRLISYLTAALINLAIVGGTLSPPFVERVPIVRLRARSKADGRFDRGELLDDGSIAVRAIAVRHSTFSAN